MKKRLMALLLLCAMALTSTVWAAPTGLVDWDSLYVYGDESLANTRVNPQSVNGEWSLFLPSGVDTSAVTVHLDITSPSAVVTAVGKNGAAQVTDGATLDLTALCGDGDRFGLTLRAVSGSIIEERTLTVYPSSYVDAMYLVSDDPENEGRQWVESSEDKSNKATGAMVLQTADGTVVYDGDLTQIKGRGNSTWNLSKKPYQIKLDKKTDLLQTGDADNKAKTWVLLANYADVSALRNTLALNLGAEMGMEYYMENRPVELYYDGEYRGTYLLCEKVEINSGRVDITDLEGSNEGANDGVDLEELETAVGQTANGATYTYCVGMNNPEDITGGYLLEMEVAYRTAAEVCYFYTTRGNYVVVKSPEFASKEQMEYIASIYQEYEDALYNDGVNPDTGRRYTDYVDLESTAMCYLINELSKNLDGFRTSAYLYKEAGVDQMKMGPLWDYDLGFGVGGGEAIHKLHQQDPEGLYSVHSTFAGMLYLQGDFREAVREIYVNTLYPLLTEVALGEAEDTTELGILRSLEYYREAQSEAAERNLILWPGSNAGSSDWQGYVDDLRDYLSARADYLLEELSQWNADTYVPQSIYLDVSDTKWYCDEILAVTKYGLMEGSGIAIFEPEVISTRAQVVQTLFNMAQPLPTAFEAEFTDLDRTRWYMPAINWAASQGIATGYEDGTFHPNDGISRQELVTLLYRYNGSPKVQGNELSRFPDADSVKIYAREAMEWAVQTGLLQGYEDGTIQPQGTTKRSELAAIILRYYENFVLPQQNTNF